MPIVIKVALFVKNKLYVEISYPIRIIRPTRSIFMIFSNTSAFTKRILKIYFTYLVSTQVSQKNLFMLLGIINLFDIGSNIMIFSIYK